MSRRLPPTRQDLIRWAEALSGIARTGLGFTQSLYERERFDEVLAVAGDIRAAAQADEGFDAEHYVDEWMKGVGEGVAGYITPKVAVGAVVHNDAGEILLVQRADSGIWLYPTGWADVGYSASEIAVKEVQEETGISCDVVRAFGDTTPILGVCLGHQAVAQVYGAKIVRAGRLTVDAAPTR